ncbi:ribonuclease R [Maricaulis sp.]|uniref:ribonuclease R n=1 Tax=Maricaulis sp. TaxID=1486257 RepID=UPI000C36E2FC|nr:ribonuclease R [Maricaulis sp.]MAC90139.1 ribonuclease R [Maricaulis sp.]
MAGKTEFDAGLTREAVIDAVREGGGEFGKRELARAMSLKGSDAKRALNDALAALTEDGTLTRSNSKTYSLPGALPAVCVVQLIGRDNDGELLAEPVRPDRNAPMIRLAPGEGAGGKGTPAIGIGDKALVRLALQEDGSYQARLIKKLGQSAHKLLCMLRKPQSGPFRLLPVDRRSRHELVPAKGEAEKAHDGDLVLCEIAKERRHGLKTARIVEVVGDASAPGAGSLIALYSHGVPQGFSETEQREADETPTARQGKREDLRALPLITIDPDDAKDHDDAVWAAPDDDPKNPGGWQVIVAIADVAAYVTPGSALDRGAFKRGNSVYLPDRVVPMLPERLSNDLCSLREKEDRPCLAVRMVFDKSGNKRSHTFMRGWMRSAAKLSYTQAQDAIDGRDGGPANALLDDVLKPLWGAYFAAREARGRREPLEIDAPERRVRVGEDGQVIGVETRQRFDAHKLVEEFMIQANVCAAETLEQKRAPLIYRVHEPPSREKIDALSDFLPTVGMKWAKGNKVETGRFNQLLKQAKSSEHYETINVVVLRSQSQAVYDTENEGHFGLNLQRYAHFTSPIRRYADLTVHRALIRALGLGDDGQSDEERSRLTVIAEEITLAERRAMAAERDAVDRFIAAYLADKIGAEFAGRITGVTRFGCFVKLDETGADGLVPISRLGEERFEHDEKLHALVGLQTGSRYRLGMPVMVRIDEAQPVTGGLLLDMLTEAEKGERPSGRRRPKSGGPPNGRRSGKPWKKGRRR